MPDSREKMHTPGGHSVRAEIEARLALAREDARSLAFDEAIAFLRLSGHAEAADDLERAAFTPVPA
jgi:hypothetical protein